MVVPQTDRAQHRAGMTLFTRLLICLGGVCLLAGVPSTAQTSLNEAAESAQKQPAQESNISALQNTFWHLIQLQGAHTDLSRVIVRIQLDPRTSDGDITFSSPRFYSSFPFHYRPSGFKFFPAWKRSRDTKKGSPAEEETERAFEKVLHVISSFELNGESLTFSNKAGKPVLGLRSVQKSGIENRVWTIARYKSPNDAQVDEHGLVEAKGPANVTFWNGRVDGSPGCGALVGTYELTGTNIVVYANYMLAGFCYPEQLSQAQKVVDDFKGELRIEQKDGNVVLRDKDGKSRISLVGK